MPCDSWIDFKTKLQQSAELLRARLNSVEQLRPLFVLSRPAMALKAANKQNTWLDAVFLLMILVSVTGLLYAFVHK